MGEFVQLYPKRCENCWNGLPEIEDAAAQYQVIEVQPMQPHVKELRPFLPVKQKRQ